MEADHYALNEIIVKGNTVMKKDGHLLIIPDKLQKEHSYTGYDLVYNMMLPGVNVDRRTGKISTIAGNVSMYINGVKVERKDIENLRGNDILKVEYYDIPTGRYAGESAVINYITKVYETGGYVSLSGEQNLGYNSGKYDVAGKISRKKTSISFYGGYNYADHKGTTELANEQLHFSNHDIDRNVSNNTGKFTFHQQYEQLKINHDTPKHHLYGMLTFIREKTPNDEKSKLLTYTGARNEQIEAHHVSSSENVKPALTLSGSFRLAKNQELSVI